MIVRTITILLLLSCGSTREPSSQRPPEPGAPTTTATTTATTIATTIASTTAGAPSSRPPRPVEPESADRRCDQDSDCSLVPDDCRSCPPCEATWRTAMNQAKVSELVAERGRIPCPPISCVMCAPTPVAPGAARAETGYIGDRAVCRARQCTVE